MHSMQSAISFYQFRLSVRPLSVSDIVIFYLRLVGWLVFNGILAQTG